MNQSLWRGPYARGLDPFRELQALRAELGRMLGSVLIDGQDGPPDVDLHQIDEGWRVVAQLPGVAPEEVAVELDDRELCIRARSEAEVNADLGMAGTGSRMSGFEYRLTLPSGVDTERIDAVMDHGLLTITLPRAGRGARRTITVGSRQFGSPGISSDRAGGRGQKGSADPAADRELHRPDVVSDIAPQAG